MLLGTASAAYGSPDGDAWRAYEAVEEAWIRDRYELLISHAPAVLSAARLDLEIRLIDLQRRALQFRHVVVCEPALLRGGIWQLAALPLPEAENAELMRSTPEYRKVTERIRNLSDALRLNSQFDRFRREQVRLWKTPQYREIHRRYMGRMQELQRVYSAGTVPPATTNGAH
ncbi:MAG TPA: hypothetical protein VES20_01665 [Bryobacteraceae bacterium]|nr:hypothetical protein [Bryobacteraceae bacterium]